MDVDPLALVKEIHYSVNNGPLSRVKVTAIVVFSSPPLLSIVLYPVPFIDHNTNIKNLFPEYLNPPDRSPSPSPGSLLRNKTENEPSNINHLPNSHTT